MANEFKVRKGLIVQGSGSTILDVLGSQGELFSVTDSLSGSLFSVNDISGIPIMEVFSDNTIKMGTFNQEAIIVSGSRTGMGTAFPQAKLHISGANNDSLFRIQSPASASIIFVSGSGNVGIGTATPTQKISIDNGNVGFTSGFGVSWDSDTEWIKRAAASDQLQFATQNTVRLNIGNTQGQLVAIGLGTTAASAQFQVRGGGATAATTAMRIEDSGGNARLTILDDGTSAFNISHLYVSSSGNIGIGTATPTARLQITGTPNDGISLDANHTSFQGVNARLPGRIIVGASSGGYPKIMYNAIPSSSVSWSYSGNDTAWAINMGGSNRMSFEYVAPGTAGTSFNSWNTIMTLVSGSNNVGIGTLTPTNTLQVVGGVTATSITSSLLGTASVAVTAQTASFLPVGTYSITSSWAVSASNAVNAQTASFLPVGTYSITSSWATNALTASNITPTGTNAFVQGGNSFGATALLGTNDTQDLQLETSGSVRMTISSSGNVGIGTITPSTTLQVAGTSSLQNIVFDTNNIYDIGTITTRARNIWSNGNVVGTTGFFNSAVMYNSARIGGEHTATALLHISSSDSAQMMRINSPSNANILFVSGSGKVGIGTATPSYTLDTVGNVRLTNNASQLILDNATYSELNYGTSNYFRADGSAATIRGPIIIFLSASTETMRINSSGNVGIGTATPVHNLVVNGNTGVSINANGATFPNIHRDSTDGGMLLRSWNGSTFTNNVKITPTTEVGIGTTSPTAELHISGANADNLFRVSSPSAANALFVSGSGNVGIGTATPTTTLNVNGTTLLQGGQTTVRGSGATSATTALRVENANASASLVVLDNGNVGISTTTPADLFTINSPSSTGSLRLTHLSEIETLRATSFHSGLYIGNNIYYSGSGDPVTNSLYAVDSGSNNRGGNLLLIRANNGTTALGGFYFYTAPSSSIANTTATLNESFRIIPSSSFFTNTRVGIGAAANTSYAFDVASSAPNAGAARINGNNTVWVFDQASQVTRGTTSLARMFLVQMGPVNASSGTQTALTISQSINQSSTAGYTTLVVNANETGTGSGNKLLQAWQFNGTNLTVINNSGSLGVGTATPTGIIDVFQGGNSRILVKADDGFVGIQQPSPTERIHITSDPATSKYLQIDATSTQAPPTTVIAPDTGYGNTANKIYLAEPDYWMEIKLNGNIVLIPCYSPA